MPLRKASVTSIKRRVGVTRRTERIITYTILLMLVLAIGGLYNRIKKLESSTIGMVTVLRYELRRSGKKFNWTDDVVRKVRKELSPGLHDDVKNLLSDRFEDGKRQHSRMKFELKTTLGRDLFLDIYTHLEKMLKREKSGILKEVASAGYIVEKKYSNLCNTAVKMSRGQKVISYSLYGSSLYYANALRELIREFLASDLYHTWTMRIHFDKHSKRITKSLEPYRNIRNVHFCDINAITKFGNLSDILGKFWRLLPLADTTVDTFCSRDIDKAILKREEDAVREWLISSKLVHVIRDSPKQTTGIIPGLWCFKVSMDRLKAEKYFSALFKAAMLYKSGRDWELLNNVVWRNISNTNQLVMQHDSYDCTRHPGAIPFPTRREDNTEYVGCPGRPCAWEYIKKCPLECRPKMHQDWEYC